MLLPQKVLRGAALGYAMVFAYFTTIQQATNKANICYQEKDCFDRSPFDIHLPPSKEFMSISVFLWGTMLQGTSVSFPNFVEICKFCNFPEV